MSGPGEAAPKEGPLLPHTPPMDYPPTSLVAVAVPKALNGAIVDATKKTGLVYADQLLAWVVKGAECERLHESKLSKTGRTKRK